MKIKRKKHDKAFSDLIRGRVNYTCEACATVKLHEKATLDCAHIMSRRSLALRWHPQNAVALCRGCHMFYTEHPFDWNDWCQDKFGGDFVAELRLVSNQTVKWLPKVREDVYKHMKSELNIMEKKRLTTAARIEFAQYALMHVFKV